MKNRGNFHFRTGNPTNVIGFPVEIVLYPGESEHLCSLIEGVDL